MSDDRPKRDIMSIEEATISNMWEIAAIVEVLERKGLCTKQDLYEIITEFRRNIPKPIFPRRHFLAVQAHRDRKQDHRHHPADAHQERMSRTSRKTCSNDCDALLEMGQRVANGTMHQP